MLDGFRHRIVKADGTVVAESSDTLLPLFVSRNTATKTGDCKGAKWGDHYRVMKVRKDPPELVAKCACGEKLIRV